MIPNDAKSPPRAHGFEVKMRPLPPGTKRRGPRPLRGSEWALPPILVDIVNTALRRIQALGLEQQAARCAVEAEHVQSLVALLVDFDPEVLERYCVVEREAFKRKSTPAELADFEPLWASLDSVLRARKEEVASGRG